MNQDQEYTQFIARKLRFQSGKGLDVPLRDYGLFPHQRDLVSWALRQTWQMVDPLKPAGQPGSYWRGQDAGIVAALTTLRANLKTPNVEFSGGPAG